MEAQSITEMYDFKGKAAIVTGGAMGIGEAIILRLAEAGASVMIADISLEVANKVVERIKSMGGKLLQAASRPPEGRLNQQPF